MAKKEEVVPSAYDFYDDDKSPVDNMEAYAKAKIIEELKKFIYHPGKPGYMRRDIIERIKYLEK